MLLTHRGICRGCLRLVFTDLCVNLSYNYVSLYDYMHECLHYLFNTLFHFTSLHFAYFLLLDNCNRW